MLTMAQDTKAISLASEQVLHWPYKPKNLSLVTATEAKTTELSAPTRQLSGRSMSGAGNSPGCRAAEEEREQEIKWKRL